MAVTGGVLAGAFAVTGVALLVVGKKKQRGNTAHLRSVTPMVSRDGAGLGIELEF